MMALKLKAKQNIISTDAVNVFAVSFLTFSRCQSSCFPVVFECADHEASNKTQENNAKGFRGESWFFFIFCLTNTHSIRKCDLASVIKECTSGFERVNEGEKTRC